MAAIAVVTINRRFQRHSIKESVLCRIPREVERVTVQRLDCFSFDVSLVGTKKRKYQRVPA
jgi:hypothetical protein